MSKTGLILRVKQITGIESILIDQFRFASIGVVITAPNYIPRRFLKCTCGYDEFIELAINFFECNNCESKITIIPK